MGQLREIAAADFLASLFRWSVTVARDRGWTDDRRLLGTSCDRRRADLARLRNFAPLPRRGSIVRLFLARDRVPFHRESIELSTTIHHSAVAPLVVR